ncbi:MULTISPECIES: putative 2-aminoethylphosphonate ABC transporter substrate-binding protein [unclassified Leisingera]|uniref:putative 2-aminoethylphosphonate ABC transporter substrate-binding protein n=1 Tax=unclassified Leisingera TaxID=2614906 RepID=UPI000371FD59|nr:MULTISPECIES: putative 2-aminoethylphosphonate ABC transporter substrate-binding protein [unclassified Leisingera]KIC24957.1 phosphonate ABC transporter substrate-binding protein [Leisingera sp. ANG-S3]KIC55186.1 phosphonate ABC transporter substrate-binding protein [Leisingera sp. ANG-S]KID08918.1 phosphonate ABC transporter substrate-binding protein [Leisingera sp. ANG1]
MVSKFYTLVQTVALACAAATASAETELTVYTALNADDLDRYAASFNETNPDIKINWVRDSTGIITAKLLAEKNNPQADAVLGLSVNSVMALKLEGMLEPYTPLGADTLNAQFVDNGDAPSWVGMNALFSAICFNTVEGEKLGIAAPQSWDDLLKPEYAGHIVMPNPNSSGAGLLNVTSWLSLKGSEDGWGYMAGLHENIARYTHSGSKPCKLAASGENLIGISYALAATKLKGSGAPIDIIIPTEGVGWDMEATAIVAGTPKLEAAQALMDWTATEDANEVYAKVYAVVAKPGVSNPNEHYPSNVVDAMIPSDFANIAKNRDTILSDWQSRFGHKSDPQN